MIVEDFISYAFITCLDYLEGTAKLRKLLYCFSNWKYEIKGYPKAHLGFQSVIVDILATFLFIPLNVFNGISDNKSEYSYVNS